jgi:hypothetical protein
VHLTDGIETIEGPSKACGVIIGGETVDDEAVGEVALTVDGVALSGNGGGLGEELGAGGVCGGDAGGEQSQVKIVAA